MPQLSIPLTSIKSPDLYVPPHIPKEFQEIRDVFGKAKVSDLPLHCPYNCAIDLLLGSTPPHNWIYPLSLTKQKTMEKYVQEALQQGYKVRQLQRGSFSW